MLSNVFALLSGTVLSRALSAVIVVVIARQLGPAAYGQYSASIALVGLTTVLFGLGLNGWLLYSGGRRQDQLTTHSTSALFLTTILGAIWLAGWWLIAPHLNASSFPQNLILLAGLSLWLEEVAQVAWSAFKARLRNDLTLFLMLLDQGTFLALTLALAIRQIQAPNYFMGAKALAALVVAASSVWLISKKIGLRLQLADIPTTLRDTAPFAISIAFTIIYGRADLAIVAALLGNEAAGIYAPALTVTNLLFLIPAAIFGVMVPLFSQFGEDSKWIRKTSLQLLVALSLVGAVLGLGLYLLSDAIIHLLYGPSFEASVDVLATLSIVPALRCVTTAFAIALVAVGWQTRRTGIQGFCAILNIALNFLLIYRYEAGVMEVAKVYGLTEIALLFGHLCLFALWMRKRQARP